MSARIVLGKMLKFILFLSLIGFPSASAAAEIADIALVLDASGSMWGQIDGKPKIAIAKEVLNELVDGLPREMRVGLFAYGHRTKGECNDIEMLAPVAPVDPKTLKAKIAALNPKGKTPLSDAVRQAARMLRYTEQRATVILVSDGLETCHADPCGLAAELAMSGVDFKVHVVGFDISREDQSRLRCLADKTGGLFLAAANAGDLRAALTQTVSKAKEPPKAVVADPGTATLKAPDSVQAGSEFKVDWQGPDSRNDIIALVLKGTKEGDYRDYTYTEKGNPARLTAPGDPGDYDLLYVHAATQKVIGRAAIKVTPVQAGLKAPAAVPLAGEFKVAWQGPDYEADFISIARPQDEPGTYLDYEYTRSGNPATLQAPSEPGEYEVRYMLATDNKLLARAAFKVEPANAQVKPPAAAGVASYFEVAWQGPANEGDFISIARSEEHGGEYRNYAYTHQGNPARLQAPSEPGTYEVRYILGKDNVILARAAITIQAAGASLQPPATVAAGAEFQVAWQGPSTEGDYITVVAPDSEEGHYESYAYTTAGNPVALRAPAQPGTYEVRYIIGQDTRMIAKAPIQVTAVGATVSAPASVQAEAEFEVQWKGPDYPGDYVTIVPADSEEESYDSFFYTSNGSPGILKAPAEPGTYEVRYVMEQDRKILARVRVTVR